MNEINNRIFNLRGIETDKIRIIKLYEKGIRVPKNYGKTGTRGQAKDKEKSLISSICRAKKSIFEYTIANDWEFWGTLTLNKEKINRYDLDKIQKKISQYLKNVKKFKYPNLTWLIVPEQHKDGAFHFHLLLTGLPSDDLRDTGKTYKNTGRKMYNWLDYEEKFGYNSFIDISQADVTEKYKISIYLTKYITKSFAEVRQNKKKYWCSKGLAKPTTTNLLVDIRTFEDYLFSYYITNNSIHKSEYVIKDKETGEICNKVYQIIEEK